MESLHPPSLLIIIIMIILIITSAAGVTAGTATAGAGVPAAILACNAAQVNLTFNVAILIRQNSRCHSSRSY